MHFQGRSELEVKTISKFMLIYSFFRFLADIVINFHTGYILDNGDGEVVLDLKKIRFHYLKTWFLIDIISTLPIDYILQVGLHILH